MLVETDLILSQQINTELGKPEEIVSKKLIEFADQFLNMSLGNHIIRCPFWMNWDYLYKGTDLYRFVPGGGKMSPQEIEQQAILKAREQSFRLKEASLDELHCFILENGIGVDCSGLVYQGLKCAYQALGGSDFENKVIGVDGQTGITKIRVKALGSDINSFEINRLMEIKPVDFIVVGESHSILIIQRLANYIFCLHASNEIKDSGVNFFPIKITDYKRGIFRQLWQEYSDDGKLYNEGRLLEVNCGGIRRLRIIEEAYNKFG